MLNADHHSQTGRETCRNEPSEEHSAAVVQDRLLSFVRLIRPNVERFLRRFLTFLSVLALFCSGVFVSVHILLCLGVFCERLILHYFVLYVNDLI